MKGDGLLINDLDLFHHRPYECLLVGHCHREVSLLTADNPVDIFIDAFWFRLFLL